MRRDDDGATLSCCEELCYGEVYVPASVNVQDVGFDVVEFLYEFLYCYLAGEEV